MPANGPVLIAYDGSEQARAAIAGAAEIMRGASAVVLYARQPLESVAAHLEGHPALEDLRGLDAFTMDASQRIAEEGAQHARDAGLDAEPRVASTVTTASEAIVEVADEIDASVVVLGSRGRRGLRAAVLGSTSTNVLHTVRRPTLVIPSAELAATRALSPL